MIAKNTVKHNKICVCNTLTIREKCNWKIIYTEYNIVHVSSENIVSIIYSVEAKTFINKENNRKRV